MEDLFKKFVNAGVGYIAQGSKSVQSTIDKLVKDNKMTQAEGKKIVDDLLKSGETKRAELEKQFQGIVERAKSTVGLGDAKPAKGKAGAKKPAPKAAAKPAAKAAGVVSAARSTANQA
ncbi:phasin family protein, partial [Hymenobacter agri]